MNAALRMRQYQQQAIFSASPDQLVVKIFEIGITACHRGDRRKIRAVLQELIGSLNFEAGGEVAQRLYNIYSFCMEESVEGDLDLIASFFTELRDVWRDHVVERKAA